MKCPECGSKLVEVQVFQETKSAKTKTKSKTRETKPKHGLYWWIFIGWWFWLFDAFLWIFAFVPRVLLHIGRKRNYETDSTSTTKSKYAYKRICVCQNCGYKWDAEDV